MHFVSKTKVNVCIWKAKAFSGFLNFAFQRFVINNARWRPCRIDKLAPDRHPFDIDAIITIWIFFIRIADSYCIMFANVISLHVELSELVFSLPTKIFNVSLKCWVIRKQIQKLFGFHSLKNFRWLVVASFSYRSLMHGFVISKSCGCIIFH